MIKNTRSGDSLQRIAMLDTSLGWARILNVVWTLTVDPYLYDVHHERLVLNPSLTVGFIMKLLSVWGMCAFLLIANLPFAL